MLIESKDEIRKIFRQKRGELSAKNHHLRSREIAKNFIANVSIARRSTVAVYIPFDNEVNISILTEMLGETGHTVCLPCVDEKNSPMIFRKYPRGTKLYKNRVLNMMEPPSNFPIVIPNVIITPTVAFDAVGSRVGLGAGYYDRTFDYLSSFTDFIAVGVAFALQQTEYIKAEPHDHKLDALVTEKKVFVFS